MLNIELYVFMNRLDTLRNYFSFSEDTHKNSLLRGGGFKPPEPLRIFFKSSIEKMGENMKKKISHYVLREGGGVALVVRPYLSWTKMLSFESVWIYLILEREPLGQPCFLLVPFNVKNYILGNSQKGFGRCFISCLLHYIHYLSIPLHTNSWDDFYRTLFANFSVC